MSTVHSSPMHFLPPAAVGTTGQVLTCADNAGATAWQTVASQNFTFTNLQFVAKGGNDLNDGLTLDTPKLTIQAAINALGLSPTQNGMVWVLDSGTYDESLVSTYSFNLWAPNAQIISNGGDLLTINDSGINTVTTITCWQFGKFSPGGLAVNLLGAQSNLFLHAQIVQGDMHIEGGFIDGNVAQVASNVHVTSTGQFGPKIINAIFMTVTVDPGGTIAGNIQSILSPGNVVNTQYGNQVIEGSLTASGLAYPTTDSTSGYVVTTNGGGVLSLQRPGLLANNIDICVSKLIGSDITGTGSPTNPFATINAAIAFAGSPTNFTNIRIIDDETYNEALNFTGISNLNLIGPQASLNYTIDATPAITTDSPLMTIDLFQIEGDGGGPTLLNTGTGAIHINMTSIQGGIIDNTSTGLISIFGDDLQIDLPNTGGGQIFYTCNIRAGTDGPGVLGQYPGSSSGSNQSSICISPTVFNYFNQITTGAVLWVSSDAPNTQGSFTGGGPTQDYGTFTFKAAAGTYNCCILYPQGTGNGIMRLIFNGGTPTDIDQYGTSVNQYVSFQFSVTLVEGDNTIQCITNGKNASSANYFLTFADSIVLNRTGP